MPVAVSPLSVPRRLDWPSVDVSGAPGSWQPYVTGLQLLGGLLSMPRRVEYQQAESDLLRQQLEGTGLSPEQIASATPDAAMKWLSPAEHPGIGGTILGGVGDVGALLSTIAGRPIEPPRASIGELAAASKLRSEYAKSQKEQQLVDAMAAGKTPEEVAALGVASGNTDAALRLYQRKFESQPWRGTPGERTTQTLQAQRDERAQRRASMLGAGYDPKTVDFWVETGNMPPQGRQTPQEIAADEAARQDARDRIEQQRREKFVAAHPELTPEQQTHYRGTGQLPTTGGPRVIDFKDLYMKTLTDAQQRVRQQQSGPFGDPTVKLDEAAVMEDALQQAEAIEQMGGTVRGKPPRRTPDAGPQETGIGMSTEPPGAPPTSTPTSTTTSTTTPPGQTSGTGLLPGWEFLDTIHPETLNAVGQAQAAQLAAQYGKMPVDAARNWATAIKAMTKKK
jgi:hypothetical protein